MYKILYVDDEPELLELGKIFLKTRWGFSVNTAISANEALVQLRTCSYDAIISDYDMPGMDGISFLKYLRNEEYKEPFILFTGKSREEVVIEALNNGADYYLQKGGDPTSQYSELVNMIKRAVQRKQAEDELDRANRLYNAIINHLPDPTFVVNTKDQIIAWNYAMEKMTGTNAQNILNKDVDDCFYQIYGVRNLSFINAILSPEHDIKSRGNVITLETKVKDSYGRERVLWVKASPLYDKNMEISGVIETIRDVTDIKKTEKELRETSQLLQNIIDFLPDPTFVIDNDGKVLAWNHAIEDLTGTKASSIIGEGDYAYSIPFYAKRRPILVDLLQVYDKETESLYDYVKKVDNHLIAETRICKLGEREDVYLWYIAAPLYDSDGRNVGAIESIRDITQRKELEIELKERYEELARSYEEIAAQNEEIKVSFCEMAERELQLTKSEKKFRSLVEHLPVGIIIHCNDRIRYVNPKAATILGYDNSKDLIGTLPLNIVNPDRRENISQRIIKSKNTQNKYINEIFLKKDRSEVPVEVTGISLMIDDFRANMTIFRDISEECNRKTALLQVRKKLDILASITQHDIRNQVTVLVTTLDLIMDEKLPDPTSTLLKTANASCKNIIESLRINTEYQTLGVKEPCWFFVKYLVFEVMQDSQLSEIISYSGGDVEIYADPLIGKVFENLIDNSFRHGGDISKIQINTINSSGDLLLIYEDDGNGISAIEKDKIFIQGYGKNTGLGLFLIKEILSVTGISIRECGRPGKGAVFEMRVPHGKWR